MSKHGLNRLFLLTHRRQAQLRELHEAQRAWEAERAALLLEVEEERLRLQQGLAEALTQASCAQVRCMWKGRIAGLNL